MELGATSNPAKRLLAIALALFALVFAGWFLLKDSSSAADIRNFDPGNLMSDAVMSDKSTMSVQDIQSFLNSKNYCDNRNVHMAAWYPHLQYNIKDGRFVCMARESFDGKSAAQLIWEAAQEYNINPQVLIVLLEKEQGLISDTWPNHIQYRSATGYGCPDTAPCDTQYYGMRNQLRLAAKLFREVLNGGWSNYPVGQRYVQYHPNAGCGGTVVNIQNRATSALYRYTPYQPNQAALNAGYGIGNDCSAYGNRNFWRLFTDWFGDPRHARFTALEEPRWMQIVSPEPKTSLYSMSHTREPLATGQQVKLSDKTQINGVWYLRTAYDQTRNNHFGIPLHNLTEIPYSPISNPLWKIVISDGAMKYTPSQQRPRSSENFPRWTAIKVTDSMLIEGELYLRTQHDSRYLINSAFLSKDLSDLTHIQPLEEPRVMVTNNKTTSLRLSGSICSEIPQNSFMYIRGKVIFGGSLYFSVEQSNINPDTLCLINPDDLNWHPPTEFISFEEPRVLRISKNINRINIHNGQTIDTLNAGSEIMFATKIEINDVWYYRTAHNTRYNLPYIIPADSTEEVNAK